MAAEFESEWLATEEEDGRRQAIAEALEQQPKPSAPTRYRVEEAAFWQHRHIPVGSVLTYMGREPLLVEAGEIAVLVLKYTSTGEGVWLEVKALGCEGKSMRSRLTGLYKGSRRFHHICYLNPEGECLQHGEPGIHLTEFYWFPPGDFNAEWLSTAGVKAVQSGITLEAEMKKPPPQGTGHGSADPSTVEARLSHLRSRKGSRVSFAGQEGDVPSGLESGTPQALSRAGALRRPADSGSQALATVNALKAKVEPIPIDSDEESEVVKRKKKKNKPRGVSEALADAVATRRCKEEAKSPKRKRKSRSRSGRRDRRRRSRRHSSSQGSSASRSRRSSSSDSLQPPLRKKSLKDPGSVFKMLINQAAEQLAQEGLEDEGATSTTRRGQKVRMYTYYQLALKPNLDQRSRDCKELGLLAKALDLLQEGDLSQLADLLSARLIAVETATRQGWQAAKFLELQSMEDDGTAPPHILLAAQKHARQVEKAGGKGSWAQSQQWAQGWMADQRPKGKGKDPKGKGKKGKNKGKGGRGAWNSGLPGEKDKGGEKPNKADA